MAKQNRWTPTVPFKCFNPPKLEIKIEFEENYKFLTEHFLVFRRLSSLPSLFSVFCTKQLVGRKFWMTKLPTTPSPLGIRQKQKLQEDLYCNASGVKSLLMPVVWRRGLSTMDELLISVGASILIVLVNLILVASCLGSVKLWGTVEKMWLLVDAPVKSNWKSFLICV